MILINHFVQYFSTAKFLDPEKVIDTACEMAGNNVWYREYTDRDSIIFMFSFTSDSKEELCRVIGEFGDVLLGRNLIKPIDLPLYKQQQRITEF